MAEIIKLMYNLNCPI